MYCFHGRTDSHSLITRSALLPSPQSLQYKLTKCLDSTRPIWCVCFSMAIQWNIFSEKFQLLVSFEILLPTWLWPRARCTLLPSEQTTPETKPRPLLTPNPDTSCDTAICAQWQFRSKGNFSWWTKSGCISLGCLLLKKKRVKPQRITWALSSILTHAWTSVVNCIYQELNQVCVSKLASRYAVVFWGVVWVDLKRLHTSALTLGGGT